jgi:hypothetical protein
VEIGATINIPSRFQSSYSYDINVHNGHEGQSRWN